MASIMCIDALLRGTLGRGIYNGQIDVQSGHRSVQGQGNYYKCENDKELMREINGLIS
jgi:hypothetical protein